MNGSPLDDFQGLDHEILEDAELVALLNKMTRARDKKPRNVAAFETLRNRVVTVHMRFALHVAKRFERRSQGVPLADLVQCAAMGIMRACETFDLSRGIKFSSYSGWWCRHKCEREIADRGAVIRTPVHALAFRFKLAAAARRFEAMYHRAPTMTELARLVDAPEAKVRTALEAARDLVSLDAATDYDTPATLHDVLADESAQDPEAVLLAKERAALARRLVGEVRDPIDRRVVTARFGLGHPSHEERTLDEVGAELGVSRERTRQRQAKALAQMKSVAAKGVGSPRVSEFEI